jgi:hypothetical protein
VPTSALKQAPRAWYSRLDKYLQQTGFKKDIADINLYIKVSQGNILSIEVYIVIFFLVVMMTG